MRKWVDALPIAYKCKSVTLMCTVPILILLKKKLCKDDLAHTLNVSGYILDEEIIQGEISRKLVNVNVVWFMNVESTRGICKAKETDG